MQVTTLFLYTLILAAAVAHVTKITNLLEKTRDEEAKNLVDELTSRSCAEKIALKKNLEGAAEELTKARILNKKESEKILEVARARLLLSPSYCPNFSQGNSTYLYSPHFESKQGNRAKGPNWVVEVTDLKQEKIEERDEM